MLRAGREDSSTGEGWVTNRGTCFAVRGVWLAARDGSEGELLSGTAPLIAAILPAPESLAPLELPACGLAHTVSRGAPSSIPISGMYQWDHCASHALCCLSRCPSPSCELTVFLSISSELLLFLSTSSELPGFLSTQGKAASLWLLGEEAPQGMAWSGSWGFCMIEPPRGVVRSV